MLSVLMRMSHQQFVENWCSVSGKQIVLRYPKKCAALTVYQRMNPKFHSSCCEVVMNQKKDEDRHWTPKAVLAWPGGVATASHYYIRGRAD